MKKTDKELALKALDRLGVLLADHRHTWSNEDRALYEKATSSLTAVVR